MFNILPTLRNNHWWEVDTSEYDAQGLKVTHLKCICELNQLHKNVSRRSSGWSLWCLVLCWGSSWWRHTRTTADICWFSLRCFWANFSHWFILHMENVNLHGIFWLQPLKATSVEYKVSKIWREYFSFIFTSMSYITLQHNINNYVFMRYLQGKIHRAFKPCNHNTNKQDLQNYLFLHSGEQQYLKWNQ